jgi:ubiquinone/menaquinone biosynthesis C-methylase UbiE
LKVSVIFNSQNKKANISKLKMLPVDKYDFATRDIENLTKFYRIPIIGALYRYRSEVCLNECNGGQRILEVGFGVGITFLNLADAYAEIHGIDTVGDIARMEKAFRDEGIETSLRIGDVVNLPFPDAHFDTVLAISVLEHLKPSELTSAFAEMSRVLKPGGQLVYGVPRERGLMRFMFRLLGYDIREHHFSTELDVLAAAEKSLEQVRLIEISAPFMPVGVIYHVGHFVRPAVQ